jgi:formate-dependent phosphoribosylglycinamide formyltransferase (GAR transformylase)
MHVVFIEPSFPANQEEFVRGLVEVGAEVTAIGEAPKEALGRELGRQLFHYEQVRSVVDTEELSRVVRGMQDRKPVDRLEATIEAHVMSAAEVREELGIPGTSVRTAFLCRDKPAMKEALREAGVPCAESIGSSSVDEIHEFARQTGFPLIVKPRAAAGAAGTASVSDAEELDEALVEMGVDRGASVAVEEFVEGHEAFYDTITIDGRIQHDFVTHYYPNVLEAMRTRWISPQFIATNRVDSAPDYTEVRELGSKVVSALGIETSATHMEWFFGPKGLKFSEIGCRPPGVRAWDLYCAGNEMDLYREWAMAIAHGRTSQKPSRRYSAGIVTLRPDRDGRITSYDGLEEIQREYASWILDFHLPPPGTPTQPVEAGYLANAWFRMRHPDYDELRRMLDAVGERVQMRAA